MVCSAKTPHPCLDPPKSKVPDEQRQINEAGKKLLGNDIYSERYFEVAFKFRRVTCHSGVLIGAGGTRCSDWPARVLAYDVSTRINR